MLRNAFTKGKEKKTQKKDKEIFFKIPRSQSILKRYPMGSRLGLLVELFLVATFS
ncbi:MAG: hypothetical protein RLZZ628_2890 [Bacteroidota bacterium]|jgi:hypothetical protein